MHIFDLDTPALLVDLDIVERNVRALAAYCREHGLRLRPHTKTHKIPVLARLQVRHGASGITVAKLGEAEVMADAGLDDILIAYPLIGEQKLKRLTALARRVRVTVAVDSLEVARQISGAARRDGVRIGVRAEFDSGFGRCGMPIDCVSIQAAAASATCPACGGPACNSIPATSCIPLPDGMPRSIGKMSGWHG